MRFARALEAASAPFGLHSEDFLVLYEVFWLPHHKSHVNYEGLWPSWSYFLMFYEAFAHPTPGPRSRVLYPIF